ncbi:hypothetical protein [Clostridium cagae]|uniref:hypothetical protein n=1 Tax=Clostridium cagae TaxID=2080751 RepID=UPI000CF66CCD|nr:hypothetical protein [Clostridium cagae]
MDIPNKVNILGTEWTIEVRKRTEYEGLEKCDAYCDNSIKLIVIEEFQEDANTLKNLDVYRKQLLRHEMIHAFLHESGLAECSTWATNEEMVDYFAKQFDKLAKTFKDVKALEL